MRIKKHGKMYEKEPPVKVEKFKCENCNCEFTCTDDEYYVDFGGANWNSSDGVYITYTICSTIKDYLVCSCPECHKIVKKIRERDNQNCFTTSSSSTWTYGNHTTPTNNPDITVTCNSCDLETF